MPGPRVSEITAEDHGTGDAVEDCQAGHRRAGQLGCLLAAASALVPRPRALKIIAQDHGTGDVVKACRAGHGRAGLLGCLLAAARALMPGPRASDIITEDHGAQDFLHGVSGLVVLAEDSGRVAHSPDKLLLHHDHLVLRSGNVCGCHYAYASKEEQASADVAPSKNA